MKYSIITILFCATLVYGADQEVEKKSKPKWSSKVKTFRNSFREKVIGGLGSPNNVRATMFTFLRTTIALDQNKNPYDQIEKIKMLKSLFKSLRQEIYWIASLKKFTTITPSLAQQQIEKATRWLLALQQIPLYLTSVVGAYVENTKRALTAAEEKANALQDQQAKTTEQDRLSEERKKLEDVEIWYKELTAFWDGTIQHVTYAVDLMKKNLAVPE